MNSSVALLFPGQGSQSVGMGRWVYEHSEPARQVGDKVNDILNTSFIDLMFSGPEELLNSTRNTQLAIFTTSLMTLAALEHAWPDFPSVQVVAGHSVGEYAALVAANILSLEDALGLLKARAEAMEQAVPQSADHQPLGGMCALLGIDLQKTQEILEKSAKNSEKGVENPEKWCCIANDNCPGQVVISGTLEGVEAVRAQALEAGAKRGVMLTVSGPFHSPWMQPAEEVLRERVKNFCFRPGRFSVVANTTAQPVTNPDDWKTLLPRQVTHTVRWRETMTHIASTGVGTYVEVGNGAVLSGLGKRCCPEGSFLSAQSLLEDIL